MISVSDSEISQLHNENNKVSKSAAVVEVAPAPLDEIKEADNQQLEMSKSKDSKKVNVENSNVPLEKSNISDHKEVVLEIKDQPTQPNATKAAALPPLTLLSVQPEDEATTPAPTI